jgi:putative ABC transport system permease protein
MATMLLARMAWEDYRADFRLSACTVLALVAVLAPLLVLFGLKFGLIESLTARLERDPSVREIVPMGGGRFAVQSITALAARPDVAFVIPRTRQIAATASLTLSDRQVDVEMIPTAAGDPLLGALPAPVELNTVILSATAAEKLGARAGDSIEAGFGRQVGGRIEVRRTALRVVAVLALEAFGRDALFGPLSLLEAAEDYRDGRAVAELGWTGETADSQAQRIYPAFRLYARELEDVENLRQYFAARELPVFTQAAAIAQVQSLSRNLSIVFWLISGLAMAGACAAIFAGALAAVERKRRDLSVLRLLGFSTGALLSFVVLQALYSGVFAALLSVGLYGVAEQGLNLLFAQVAGEHVSQLLPRHYLLAGLAVLGVSALAATLGGRRVARIEASEGIRDV